MGNGYKGKHVKNNPEIKSPTKVTTSQRLIALLLAIVTFGTSALGAISGHNDVLEKKQIAKMSEKIDRSIDEAVLDYGALENALYNEPTKYEQYFAPIEEQYSQGNSRFEKIQNIDEIISEAILNEIDRYDDPVETFKGLIDADHPAHEKLIQQIMKSVYLKLYHVSDITEENVKDTLIPTDNGPVIMQRMTEISMTEKERQDVERLVDSAITNEMLMESFKIILEKEDELTFSPIVYLAILIENHGIMNLPERWINPDPGRLNMKTANGKKEVKTIQQIKENYQKSLQDPNGKIRAKIEATIYTLSYCQMRNVGASSDEWENLKTVLESYTGNEERAKKILRILSYITNENCIMLSAYYYNVGDRQVVSEQYRIYPVKKQGFSIEETIEAQLTKLANYRGEILLPYQVPRR